MDLPISFLIGFISGILYNEHIYRQSIIFPRRSLFLSFWVRLIILGAFMLPIGVYFETKGLLTFLVANLLARFLHTVLRGFVIVRY